MLNDHGVIWTTTASISWTSLITHLALLFRVEIEIAIVVVKNTEEDLQWQRRYDENLSMEWNEEFEMAGQR